jgi:hypothetical protein
MNKPLAASVESQKLGAEETFFVEKKTINQPKTGYSHPLA